MLTMSGRFMVGLNFLLPIGRRLPNRSDDREYSMSFPTRLVILEMLTDKNWVFWRWHCTVARYHYWSTILCWFNFQEKLTVRAVNGMQFMNDTSGETLMILYSVKQGGTKQNGSRKRNHAENMPAWFLFEKQEWHRYRERKQNQQKNE